MQVPDGLSELIMSDDGSLVLLQLPVRDVAEATVADTGTADGFPVTVPLVFRPVPDGPPLRPGA